LCPVKEDPKHQNAHGDRHPILKLNAEKRETTNQPLFEIDPHKDILKIFFGPANIRFGG
jgi:hypothetical protein